MDPIEAIFFGMTLALLAIIVAATNLGMLIIAAPAAVLAFLGYRL